MVTWGMPASSNGSPSTVKYSVCPIDSMKRASRNSSAKFCRPTNSGPPPIFQSDQDWIAHARDIAFLPAGRLPGGRGHMLRVLSGTQYGFFGTLKLKADFLRALTDLRPPL